MREEGRKEGSAWNSIELCSASQHDTHGRLWLGWLAGCVGVVAVAVAVSRHIIVSHFDVVSCFVVLCCVASRRATLHRTAP
jgi:hypothetical protein